MKKQPMRSRLKPKRFTPQEEANLEAVERQFARARILRLGAARMLTEESPCNSEHAAIIAALIDARAIETGAFNERREIMKDK